jgi:hypothetical protein
VPRTGDIGFGIAAISWKLLVSDRHKRDVAAFCKLVLDIFNYRIFSLCLLKRRFSKFVYAVGKIRQRLRFVDYKNETLE